MFYRRFFSSQTLLASCLLAVIAMPVQSSQSSALQLTGRSYDYRVANYHICVEFNSENSLRWIYLAAPEPDKGKTSAEQFDRKDIRANQVLAAWTEQDGTHVTDLFDFEKMKLYASFVMPNGQRFLSEADISAVNSCSS